MLTCFLHSMNTIIGKICTFLEMKAVIAKNVQIVSFFNHSHYWGGQLKSVAKEMNIN